MDRRTFLATVAAAGGLAQARPACSAETPSKPDAARMPKRRLGRSGIEVSALALGGFTGMKEVRTAKLDPVELATTALELGITYFDTAPAYNDGQSERNYGEVVARRRKEIFLATKTGQRSYDGAMREVEASLKRLRTDRVDLLQIHATRADEDPAAWDKPDGVLRALRKLRDEKVTRLIGVTGHESAEVLCRAIAMYEFDTILTTFNPTPKRRPYLENLLPLAEKKQMGILAMKVMGGAFGSLALGNPPKNDGAANHDDAPRQAEAGLLVQYVLGLPISAAVVGVKSLAELRTNVRAACVGAGLNESERKALAARMAG